MCYDAYKCTCTVRYTVQILVVPYINLTEIIVSLDLRASNVDAVTLGQYMQPTKRHIKVLYFTFDCIIHLLV